MISFNKIFGIGLNKTATTSLAQALNIIGIPTMHWAAKLKNGLKHEKKNDLKLLSTFEDFLGFTDYPIDEIYQELDKVYPGSKFIYTWRDLNSWLKSRELHVRRNQQNPDYKGNWLQIDQKAWATSWKSHQQKVYSYFEKRPHDLLVMNICDGDGWEKLCEYLDVPVPAVNFPKVNAARTQLNRQLTKYGTYIQTFRDFFNLSYLHKRKKRI